MSVRRAALASTCLGTREHPTTVLEKVILSSGDLLRWLWYKETGLDDPTFTRQQAKKLRAHYLVHLWLDRPDLFEQRVAALPEKELNHTKELLPKVMKWGAEWKERRKVLAPTLPQTGRS